jgi:hypothetical protein
LSAKEPSKVLGTVNHSEDLNAAFERPVEDENLLAARDDKEPQTTQFGKAKLWIPAHLRLSRKQ